jgi:predicted flap endonuclease-1-like 5' DNA nuclease
MVVTHSEWEKKIIAKFKEPKTLTKAKAPWVESTREPNVIYKGDPVTMLPRIGSTVATVLADHGVKTVEEYEKHCQTN